MSHTSPNILKDLSLQNHALWLKINSAVSNFLSVFRLQKKDETQGEAEDRPNRFIEALKRIEFKYGFEPNFSEEAPYGFFRNRHIIGEQTKISDGIFVSAVPGEALVVDEKYGILNEVYLKLISRTGQIEESNPNYEYQLFSCVINLTRETLRYSEEAVENIIQVYKIQPDEKVSLDLYIKKRIGVSRHQVLLAAYLLEKLQEKSLIRGTFWIDQNFSEEIKTERLVFKSADGEIFRFDPTKGLGKTAIH